jgi:hypothetical protein
MKRDHRRQGKEKLTDTARCGARKSDQTENLRPQSRASLHRSSRKFLFTFMEAFIPRPNLSFQINQLHPSTGTSLKLRTE